MNNLPAIPEPTSTPVPALLDACEAVAAWADQCDDIGLVQEVYDRMAAVAEYLARQDHARSAQATLRRIELRIGELVGPAQHGGDRKTDQFASAQIDLAPRRIHEFRKMAANPDVVEQVIAESTDAAPPSRAKVLNAIKELEQVAKQAAVEQAEWNAGLAEQREWAAGFKAKEGDDWRRRDKAEGAALSFIHDAKAFLERITPDDLAYALDTGFQHVATRLRADLAQVLDQLDDYRKAL